MSSHPTNQSRAYFKKEFEVKFPPSGIELMSHEKVINDISCQIKSKPIVKSNSKGYDESM